MNDEALEVTGEGAGEGEGSDGHEELKESSEVAGEGSPAGEDGAEDGGVELHGLTPEIQAKIDRRIGKEVAKRKAAEEKLEEAERRASEGEQGARARSAGLHPNYVTADESKVVERADYLKGVRRFCLKFREGYEGKGDKDPSYTAEEIRDRFAEVDEELLSILPKAERIRERAQGEMEADLKRGRAIRLGAVKKDGAGMAGKSAPAKLPGGGTGKSGPAASAAGGGKSNGFESKKLMEEPNDENLQTAYEGVA